eukprot:NODE_1009_length_1621_cov_73.993639_g834_i0.p1 GENE.NODE_1009_length_1621_cov_73.993639_g834_i0~~NODE_1009_length_1621_cov_73.993639_g834_i0.p1  ORF type:complete len:458 (-),score=93.33 NODE_1009_length_1621_cov_73.993639_g834_i0:92-1465(-)
MTYNGVGLATVRGTGTSGYVQKNWAFIDRSKQPSSSDLKGPVDTQRRAKAASITEHENRRQIEVTLMTRRTQLEESGSHTKEAVEKIISRERERLTEAYDSQAKAKAGALVSMSPVEKALRLPSSTQRALAQIEKKPTELHRTEKDFARAFGVDEDNFKEGQGFDFDRQEALKEKAKVERDQKMREDVLAEIRRELAPYEAELKAFYNKRRAAKKARKAARAAKKGLKEPPESESLKIEDKPKLQVAVKREHDNSPRGYSSGKSRRHADPESHSQHSARVTLNKQIRLLASLEDPEASSQARGSPSAKVPGPTKQTTRDMKRSRSRSPLQELVRSSRQTVPSSRRGISGNVFDQDAANGKSGRERHRDERDRDDRRREARRKEDRHHDDRKRDDRSDRGRSADRGRRRDSDRGRDRREQDDESHRKDSGRKGDTRRHHGASSRRSEKEEPRKRRRED